MNITNLQTNIIDILNYIIKRDNLKVDDVLKDMDTMKREKTLEQQWLDFGRICILDKRI